MVDLYDPPETARKLPVDVAYPYHDQNGKLLFYQLRLRKPDGGKTFCYFDPAKPPGARGRFSKPEGVDADSYLYQMPKFWKAFLEGADIWWCAGEKDADRVQKELSGLAVATTMHGGEGKPIPAGIIEWFKGFTGDVYVIGDRDTTGLRDIRNKYEALTSGDGDDEGWPGLDKSQVRLRRAAVAAPGADAYDHLEKLPLSKLNRISYKKVLELLEDAGEKSQRDRSERKATTKGQERLASFHEAMRAKGLHPADSGEDWNCPYPDHTDNEPSFGVKVGDDQPDKLVLYCQVCFPNWEGEDDAKAQWRAWMDDVLEFLELGWDAIQDVQEDPAKDIPQSDTDAAEWLYARHGESIRYVDVGRQASYWMLWDGLRWRKDIDGLVERWVTDITTEYLPRALANQRNAWGKNVGVQAANTLVSRVRSYSDASRIESVLRRLRTVQPGMTVIPDQLDAEKRLLGVANGMLRLDEHGVKLQDPDPKALLTMNTGVILRPDAVSTAWEDFLDTFLPDEEMELFVRKVMGYALIGGNPHRLFFLLHGPTMTGKSTFLSAVDRALGDYAAPFELTALKTKVDTGPREDIADIVHARVVYASEISARFNLHSDQIKRMTGNDKQSFSRKHMSQEHAWSMFTSFLACNGIPEVSGADVALRNRLCVIPFTEQVDSADEAADALLTTAAREGVLAWIAAGYDAYCREGLQQHDWPTPVVRATMEARHSLDHLDLFIEEMCVVGPEHRVLVAEINNAWRMWSVQQGLTGYSALPGRQFGDELHGKGFEAKNQWDKESRSSPKFRLGIALKDASRVRQ